MDNIAFHARNLFDITLTDDQCNKFEMYTRILSDWNEKINLTALRSSSEIRVKHFLDSMGCSLVWSNNIPNKLIDVGTGAGFPGLVLAIVYPHMFVTIIDSIGKKVRFCRYVVDTLQLSNVEIIQERAEVLKNNAKYKESYDVAVARAVAPLAKLIGYLYPFVKEDGIIIAMKGINVQQEIELAEIHQYKTISYTLPEEINPRMLVVIRKNG